MYFTYMLRCEDSSIYTGITTDLERRLSEHCSKNTKCAKYTLTRTAMKFEAVWQSESRSLASKLEYNLKKLNKNQKEKLIKGISNLQILLGEKLNCEEYRRVKL